jgi:hypothetical protein
MPKAMKRPQQSHRVSESDPSIYLLGLPKSYPRIGIWLAVAIFSGIVLACAVLALEALRL